SVEDREIQGAVEDGLLTRGSARFLRPSRIVEPDINSLYELARHVHVVVLDEDDLARERLFLGPADDALNQLLAHAIFGVGLAAEDDLDRTVGRADEIRQPFHVLQDQTGPLVSGEPAGEADRQRTQVESMH